MKNTEKNTRERTNVLNLIILDASGSMNFIYDQALSGLNETIRNISSTQKDIPEQRQFLTLVSFSNGDEPLNVIYKLPKFKIEVQFSGRG